MTHNPQKNASDVIAKATAALAESVGSIVDADDDKAAALTKTFEQFQDYLEQSVQGDEAEDREKRVARSPSSSSPAIEFDAGDHHYTFPDERALAVWLAAQERINKQEESLTKE
jgi:hypothetical protein